jgi:hypothetical protein
MCVELRFQFTNIEANYVHLINKYGKHF